MQDEGVHTMLKSLLIFTGLICATMFTNLFASCCQSVDVSVGWRRDSLDWKMKDLESSYIDADAKSHIHFHKIDSYTCSAKARWVDSFYYIRLSGEYGTTEKGRARELFKIHSPFLRSPVDVETSAPIKRRSEVWDVDLAVGYPFSFLECRLSVISMIGFSFHRQRLRVKSNESHCCCHSSSSSSCSSSSSTCPCSDYYSSCSSSSSLFKLCSSNHFLSYLSSNPFSSYESPEIADALGLCTHHRTSMYRFTWYGFYLGADIAYALDSCWTLYTELEYHFFDSSNRKRKSWTGVSFIDSHHDKGWAYGFTGTLGVNYCWCDCWYGTLGVDFKWWKAPDEHENLYWRMVGAKIGIGYVF
jgi:hypothetical protein